MQNIQPKTHLKISDIINPGMITTVLMTTVLIYCFGWEGVVLGCILGAFVLTVPFIYNKPEVFMITALFIYPYSRILSPDEKFVLTALLYAISLPSAIFLAQKYLFKQFKQNSFFLFTAVFGSICAMNILRMTGYVDVLKDTGRAYFSIFIAFAVFDFIKNNYTNFHKMLTYFSIFFNITAIVAILQFLTKKGGFIVEGFYRARGVFYNFNEYGYVISIFICLCLWAFLNAKKGKAFWVGTMILNLAALFTTLSKTSIILTGLVFVLMSLFLPIKRKLQIFLSGGFLIAISLLVINMTGYWNTLANRFQDQTSLVWRLNMWQLMKSMIYQGNALIGEGANASRLFLEQILPMGESVAPHNIYLETFYNYGLVGLIPFCAIFILLLFKSFQIYLKADKTTGAALMILTVITIVQNFVSNAFYDRAVNIIFWAIIALLICFAENSAKNSLKTVNTEKI